MRRIALILMLIVPTWAVAQKDCRQEIKIDNIYRSLQASDLYASLNLFNDKNDR